MFQPQTGRLITEISKTDVTAPLLFTDDKNLLNRYFNDLQLYYRVTFNHKKMLLDLKEKQSGMIEYFKNKYHLD